LDEFVVMPNHFHGIVIIQCRDVETHSYASLQGQFKNKFGPQSKNLAAIIRGFKGTTTKQIHSAGFCDFAWQPRYYEHIIRNENESNSIREYILNNPLQWELDRNNPNNPQSLKNH
jgi:REP element-mobilizing transposase RayT